MNKQLTKANGFMIEYIEEGKSNRDTIVFAHGLGGNIYQWEEQIKYFSNHYHVIAFSLQGHGESSISDKSSNYEIKAYTKTVTQLLKKLQIEDFIWIGNSMGGVIGYQIIKEGHLTIKKMITNGTTPELVFRKSALKMMKYLDNFIIKIMGFDKYIRFAVNNTTKDNNVRKKVYDMMIQTYPYAIVQSHQILGNYSYINVLNEGYVPVVAIMTKFDKDINKSIEKSIKKLNDKANIRYIKLNQYGHVFNMEAPQAYNNLVESIISE